MFFFRRIGCVKTGASPAHLGLTEPVRIPIEEVRQPMADVVFIVVILAVFGALALAAKGVEKL
jgi:hypothetical protein